MSTKTISITEEAYSRLASKKEKNESFSNVINRLTNKVSLLELTGILTEEEANKLERNIKISRKYSKIKLENIKRELKRI